MERTVVKKTITLLVAADRVPGGLPFLIVKPLP
jgi:hypothetical protein